MITDVVTLVLFLIFLGCVAALVIFWYLGKIDYSTSAAPGIFEKVSVFVKENPFIIYGIIGLAIFVFVFFVALRIRRRLKRKDINLGMLRYVESQVIPEGVPR